MKRIPPLLGLLTLMSCDADETLTKYGGAAHPWRLIVVDGVPVSFPNEVSFGPHGSVIGTGPCSTFNARQTAPYPWFELEVFDLTQDATAPCEWSTEETAFFVDLQEMTLVEVSGATLILSNDDGREMTFAAVTRGE